MRWKRKDWKTDWLKKKIEPLRSKLNSKKSLTRDLEMNKHSTRKISKCFKKSSEKTKEDIKDTPTKSSMKMLWWPKRLKPLNLISKRRKRGCPKNKLWLLLKWKPNWKDSTMNVRNSLPRLSSWTSLSQIKRENLLSLRISSRVPLRKLIRGRRFLMNWSQNSKQKRQS